MLTKVLIYPTLPSTIQPDSFIPITNQFFFSPKLSFYSLTYVMPLVTVNTHFLSEVYVIPHSTSSPNQPAYVCLLLFYLQNVKITQDHPTPNQPLSLKMFNLTNSQSYV